jgi:hypothetical protein
MTIEAQATLPAGWYSDPAQSGGDRWWDGAKWTDHLRMLTPTVPAPTTAPAAAPTFAPTAAPTFAPTAAPTFMPASAPSVVPTSMPPAGNSFAPIQDVISAPDASWYDERAAAVHMRPGPPVSNGAAVLALLFGAVALGLAVAHVLPGNRIWVLAACLIALIWGIRAVVRRRSGAATILWAPVVGILLGVIATASVFVGGEVISLVSSVVPQPAVVSTAAAAASAPKNSAEPLVFPSNASLTADETGVQTLATALNRMYASGKATLAPGHAWPASLRMSGSVVLASNGARVAALPVGLTATYVLSADKSSYRLSVTGKNIAELATYGSGVNGFSWSCPANDRTCTPSN